MMIESNDVLYRQGLQQLLVFLEEQRLQFIGDADPPMVCASCYTFQEECRCEAPLYWPLPAVVYKLRAEMRAD